MAFINTKRNANLNFYNKKTINEIYQHAKKIGIETKPFDIFAYIINIPEIDYWEDYFDNDISGKIEYKISGIYQIVVNKYHSLLRRRFALAHEFAHFVLHKELLTKINKIEDCNLFKNNYDKKELEANHFAMDLLMPKEVFETEIRKGNNKINGLADFFQVSYEVIKYRSYSL